MPPSALIPPRAPRPGVLQLKLPPSALMQARAAPAGKLPQVPPPANVMRAPRPAVPPAALAQQPRQAKLIQRHKTLPPAKIYAHAPAERPWMGYPYAIVGTETFNAQARAVGVGAHDAFLTGAGPAPANVVAHPGGLSLRVSDDAEVAIEDSDLTTRQPKVFFATAAVVAESNRLLTAAQSRIVLHTGAAGITIWTGWWTQKTLLRVTPRFNAAVPDPLNPGNPDLLPQNCNAVAAQVTGWEPEAMVSNSSALASRTAARLAPTEWGNYRDAYHAEGDFDARAQTNAIASAYVTATGTRRRDIETARANRYARPAVGEAFITATMGDGPPNLDGTTTVRDYRSGTDRNLGWSFHFGGVVARSGNDRVTLENYARGDNRANQADPRWYFQMYGEQARQSFHEVSDASNSFANPVTIAVNRGSRGRALHNPDE